MITSANQAPEFASLAVKLGGSFPNRRVPTHLDMTLADTKDADNN